MKKFLFALIVGFTFTTALSYGGYAQSSKKRTVSNDEKNFMPSILKLAKMENPSFGENYILGRNYINIRAIRDFLYRFDKVDNAVWFSAPDGGFEAYFIQDGYGDRIMYDKKGRWKFSLLMYGEGKLPGDIRAAVKSIYFDLNITLVEEIQTNEGIEHVVYLEDQSNIRVVKVNREGGIEVLQELTK